MEKRRIVLVTQARLNSSRLPRKIFLKVRGQELLKIHLNRLEKISVVSKIIVATTMNSIDDEVIIKCKKWGFETYRGSEDDVLDRYYNAVKDLLDEEDYIVRVTSDCPLIDPALAEKVILFGIENGLDYCSNVLIESYPDGQDVEVFKFSALKMAWKNAKLKSQREHVTPYIKDNSSFRGGQIFKSDNFLCESNFNHIRMTVDEMADYLMILKLTLALGCDSTWEEYTDYIVNNDLQKMNLNIIRNEGYLKSLLNDNDV